MLQVYNIVIHNFKGYIPFTHACSVTSVMSDSLPPYGQWPTSSVRGILQARILEWVAMPSFTGGGDLPDPGIEPGSPASSALYVDSLLLSHQGSPYSIYSYYQILAIFPTLHNISSEFLLYVTVCTSYSFTPILTLLPSLSLLLITPGLFSL